MNYHNLIFWILLVWLLTGCKVAEVKIVGQFIDRKTGDTLSLFGKDSYEYKQKLTNGEFGWNTGNFLLDKKRISFLNTQPFPVVGYKMQRKVVDTSTEPLHLQFQLNGKVPFKPLLINKAEVLFNSQPLDQSYFKISLNQIIIKTAKFDSVVIFCSYFPPFSFAGNKFDKNKLYQILITPIERLYELDKYSYKYSNRSLSNRKQKIKLQKITNSY